MEREDWMHVGMVVSGAALGLAARVFFKSKCMKKAAVGATAAALRIQKCAEKSAACLRDFPQAKRNWPASMPRLMTSWPKPRKKIVNGKKRNLLK